MVNEKSEDIFGGLEYRTDFDNTLPFIIIGFTDMSYFKGNGKSI